MRTARMFFSEEEIVKECNKYLLNVSVNGDWEEGFRAYRALQKQRVPLDVSGFSLLMTSCAVAKPPNSAASAAVLAEMRKAGVKLTATHFNRAISCCKLAKTWRRALVVFKAMRECGFKPSTATLELLTDACATANAEDAPDVYSALRAHDVPEFVAYTASMKCVYGPTVTWGAKSDVGIAMLDGGAGAALPVKRKPARTRKVATSIWP